MKLTVGEKLELARRRKDLTQKAMAGYYGVAVGLYRDWEHDDTRRDLPPPPPVGALERFERCWLARRRSGRTLREVSIDLGLHLKWVHRAERGELTARAIAPLVHYWAVLS